MNETSIRRNRLLWVSILIVLIVTMTPGNGKIAGNQLDKVAHFLIFLNLGINICYKYSAKKRLELLLWAMLFALLTEVVQQFIPGRGMDIYDGIADCLGVVLGYYFYQANRAKLDSWLIKTGA